MSLLGATELYVASRKLTIHDHRYSPAALRSLEFSIRALLPANRVAADDETWLSFWVPACKYRREAAASGLPLNAPELLSSEEAADHARAVPRVAERYAAYSREIGVLAEALRACRAIKTSPLPDELFQLLGTDGLLEVGQFRDDERLRAATEAFLRQRTGRPDLRVLGPRRLNEVQIKGRLLLLGPLYRFPEHLLLAPRASVLHVIRYEWSPNSRLTGKLLPGTCSEPVEIVEPGEAISVREVDPTSDGSLNLTSQQLEGVLGRLSGAEGDEANEGAVRSEQVPVRLFRLAGGRGLFLERGTRARILDLDGQLPSAAGPASGTPGQLAATANAGLPVHLVDVEMVENGHYVIEREADNGLSIDELARTWFGRRREALEAEQREWKKRLANALHSRGAQSISQELLPTLPTASPQNLRNWSGDQTFLPEERQSFQVLMQFVGLAARAERLWQVGKELQEMNRDTGREVAALLLEALQAKVSREQLLQSGHLRFTPDDFSGASLFVARVVSGSRADWRIPRRNTRRLFDDELLESFSE